MIQQGVHFDAALGLAERGPGKKGQTELDGGGIQAEQLGLETKFVFRSFCRAQAVHLGEHILKKANRAGILGIGKSGADHVFQTEMVETTSYSPKATQSVTHGAPCGKLNEGHDRELLLEAEPVGSPSCLVSAFELLKNMSGNKR